MKSSFLLLCVFLFPQIVWAQGTQKFHRGPGFPPREGPYVHWVKTAVSDDGLTWTKDHDEKLVEHASVPSAVVLKDGTIMMYFVDASQGPDRLGCMESRDNGKNFTLTQCTIQNLSSVKAVDFCPVDLPDGRIRLYYYASGQMTDTHEKHRVNSAIASDGRHFVEEGVAFEYDGLVDPDVFYNGEKWIMHVFSLTAKGTIVATSSDGRHFSYYGLLSPEKTGVTRPIALPQGGFRMYGFPQPWAHEFVSLFSQDGFSWQKEEGVRLSVSSDLEITDPFVILQADGKYRMVYKEHLAHRQPTPK